MKYKQHLVWNRVFAILGISSLAFFLTFCSLQTTQTPVQFVLTGSRPAPTLGIALNQSLEIALVEQGSAAERGGLQLGDLVKSVNGTAVTAPRAARNAFHSQDLSKPTTLVILRDSVEQTFEILPAHRILPPTTPGVPLPTATAAPADLTFF